MDPLDGQQNYLNPRSLRHFAAQHTIPFPVGWSAYVSQVLYYANVSFPNILLISRQENLDTIVRNTKTNPQFQAINRFCGILN